jgi:Na+-transporting methylmalonyl-CoA/oxaloacetate decarboxylase gamma subunit
MYANQTVTVADSLLITVFSMAIVFLPLSAICLVRLQGARVRPAASPADGPVADQTTVAAEQEEELLAVITTALAEETGMASDAFAIRSMREIAYQQSVWPQKRIHYHLYREGEQRS